MFVYWKYLGEKTDAERINRFSRKIVITNMSSVTDVQTNNQSANTRILSLWKMDSKHTIMPTLLAGTQ